MSPSDMSLEPHLCECEYILLLYRVDGWDLPKSQGEDKELDRLSEGEEGHHGYQRQSGVGYGNIELVGIAQQNIILDRQ
jgi:hypothetical protein